MEKFISSSTSKSINKLAKVKNRNRNLRYTNFHLRSQVENLQREKSLMQKHYSQQENKLGESLELVEQQKKITYNWQSTFIEERKIREGMEKNIQHVENANRNLKRQLDDLSSSSQERERILQQKKCKLSEQSAEIVKLRMELDCERDQCCLQNCELSIQKKMYEEKASHLERAQHSNTEMRKEITFLNDQTKSLFEDNASQKTIINGQKVYIADLENRVHISEPALEENKNLIEKISQLEAREVETSNIQRIKIHEMETAVMEQKAKNEQLLGQREKFLKFFDDVRVYSSFPGRIHLPIEDHLDDLAAHVKIRFQITRDFTESLQKMMNSTSSSAEVPKQIGFGSQLTSSSSLDQDSNRVPDFEELSSQSSLVHAITSSNCNGAQLRDDFASVSMLEFPPTTAVLDDAWTSIDPDVHFPPTPQPLMHSNDDEDSFRDADEESVFLPLGSNKKDIEQQGPVTQSYSPTIGF